MWLCDRFTHHDNKVESNLTVPQVRETSVCVCVCVCVALPFRSGEDRSVCANMSSVTHYHVSACVCVCVCVCVCACVCVCVRACVVNPCGYVHDASKTHHHVFLCNSLPWPDP